MIHIAAESCDYDRKPSIQRKSLMLYEDRLVYANSDVLIRLSEQFWYQAVQYDNRCYKTMGGEHPFQTTNQHDPQIGRYTPGGYLVNK
jgi:hypothetical protein